MKRSKAFQQLLRLLPRDFRSQYSHEMEQTFQLQRAEAHSRPQVAGIWARTATDLFSIGLHEHWEQFRQDVHYALRDMKRRPGFLASAVLALAIGMGLNAAMFSALYSVLLRPLPYAQPQRLVAVWNHWQGTAQGGFSDPEYLDLSERSRTLTLAAMGGQGVAIASEHRDAERVAAAYLSSNGLEVLGITPMLGRGFAAEEETPGRNQVALLSEALWRSRFNSAQDIVGHTLLVNATPTIIIGVLPANAKLPLEFGIDENAALVLPLEFNRAAPRNKRGGHYLQVVGRLKDGATLDQARAELDGLYTTMKQEYAGEYDIPGFGGHLLPLRDDLLGSSRKTLLILCLAVALVLLLACANVANLMLARGEARRAELAVRVAMGASRFRIVRQLVTEGLVLSALGGTLGLGLAALCQKVMLHWASNGAVQLPRLQDVSLDAPVIFFTMLMALLTPVLFGLLPAFPVTRTAVSDVLRGGARGGGASMRPKARRALMTAQVAIATVLLIASGLLLKSFVRVLQQPSGLRADHVLTFRVSLPSAQYPRLHEISSFYTRLVDDVAQLPGVKSAGASSGLPMAVSSGDWSFDVEGRPSLDRKHAGRADWYVVTPGYFESLGIGLDHGRLPQVSDDEAAAKVIFLNQTAAKTIFKNEDPVGKRIRLTTTTGGEQPWRTIAGVVEDVKQRGLDSPTGPEMFIPHTQFQHFSANGQVRSMSVVVRSSVEPMTLMPTIRSRLATLDPLVPASKPRTMETVITEAVADRRMTLDLIGAFGVLAILLAVIGIYGVMDYSVLQRTREIGVRIALGATREGVQSLIVRDGMKLVLVGMVAGMALAVAFGRVLAELLFEVKPNDIVVYAATAAAVMMVALLAIYLPARRGSSMNPVQALRVD